jgi:hypothetical protein
MPRESTIQIYRSTLVDTPTGLTFGELAYSDVNGKLFVGRTGGSSLWIGAGVTTGNISNNSTVLVPTQSAVKTYVDGVVGGGSVVNSVNNSSGAIVVTGDSGAILATVSGTNTTFGARLATTSLTGVASFNGTRFSVTDGAVDLASAFQVTGDRVSAGNAITVTRSGNSVTIDNNGVRTLNGATGAITITGAGAITYTQSGTSNTINARVASTSLTGVASFNSASFDVSAGGDVTIKTGGVSNTQLANSSIIFAGGGGSSTINLGQTLTITGTANETVVTNSAGTITVGLANNVTIPGNLTVNGTVFTANVDTFVVEDSLIALGTGNAADSLDLGWFGIYTSGATRYAGSFRDASDSGKFKFFTGLTAQPTGTIDTSAATYTVATIVANIDGGTF